MSTEVTHKPSVRRYLISSDGTQAGFLEYEDQDEHRLFTHTVVDPAFRGEGLASILVRAGIADTVANTELKVVSACSYVTKWIEMHPGFIEETRSGGIDPELGNSCRIV
jgi:predicted GNAT family acetyltransferase